jgi:hypothetical protein
MKLPVPQQWPLYVALRLRRTHPATLALVVTSMAAALLWWGLLPAGQRQLQELQTQAAAARMQLRQQTQQPPSNDTPQAQQNLDDFWDTVGEAKHAEQQVRSLFAIAREVALPLPQGQYKLSCDERVGLCQYRIQLPLHGSYAQVRTFMVQTLRAIPFAALDELKLKREAVGNEDLDAQLNLTLYLRAGPPVPATVGASAPMQKGAQP